MNSRRHRLERPVTWVALAGFMGTGKSRIGWELSRRLGLNFIDTDRVIERVSCLRIPDLFELYGEAVFPGVRERSGAALAEARGCGHFHRWRHRDALRKPRDAPQPGAGHRARRQP